MSELVLGIIVGMPIGAALHAMFKTVFVPRLIHHGWK